MTQPHTHPSPAAAQYHLAGQEFLVSGQVEDAVRWLRYAVDLDPRCASAWNDLGVILEALGNTRDAIYCYRRALQARPGMDEPRRNLLALAVQGAARPLAPPAGSRAAVAAAR